MPASIESAPRLGPTERSSITSSVAGSAPDAQQDGEIDWRDSTVKLPEIWPVPPRMSVADDGCGDHLAVEHDGEGPADIVRCEALPKRARRRS